jgi:hypothetical protein
MSTATTINCFSCIPEAATSILLIVAGLWVAARPSHVRKMEEKKARLEAELRI